MPDHSFPRPIHIAPTKDHLYLQQLAERVTEAIDEPVCIDLTIAYKTSFRIELSTFDGASAIRRGDDFALLLEDAIADLSGQISASRNYSAANW